MTEEAAVITNSEAIDHASKSTSDNSDTIANNNANQHHQFDWLTILPSILESRQLSCNEQTMESAKQLQEVGLLGNFTEAANDNAGSSSSHLSTQVEMSLLESFIEDDYDGRLHLTTLNDSSTADGPSGKPVGFIFWREMPKEEMKDWINFDNLRERLLGEQQRRRKTPISIQQKQDQNQHHLAEGGSSGDNSASNSSDEENNDDNDNNDTFDAADVSSPSPLPHRQQRRRMRKSLRMVRNESIRWLEVASTTTGDDAATANDDDDDEAIGNDNNNASLSFLRSSLLAPASSNGSSNSATRTTSTILEEITHSWVKIELLAVHPDHWQQHLGTLLLASAMYQAHQLGDQHVILHVAGGKENVPALKLYEKFGFLQVPDGTIFHKPNRDLFVLGHVGESLQQLCWPALDV